MKRLKEFKQMLLIALVDAIASQFYLGILVEGFRITLSVVFFPVLLNLYKSLNPIKTAIVAGTLSILSRSLVAYISHQTFTYGFLFSYQELTFYILYGILYYFMYYRHDDKTFKRWFVTIWICDFVSNTGEMFTRLLTNPDEKLIGIIMPLMAIALLRAAISSLVLYLLKNYKLLIVKEEHREKYTKMISLATDLKSEVYFMNKNIDYLENVMGSAYTLYEHLAQEDRFIDLKDLSLSIAKDVHEIKKDYIRVITGLKQITDDKIEYSEMTIKEIMDLLKENTMRHLRGEDYDIHIDFHIESDIHIKDHYSLMSVLRNLLNNAIEAITYSKGKGSIRVEQRIEEDTCIFVISDNGRGIKERDLAYIFKPGFSTKFNEETGDINRGIGLTVVKNIVEDTLKGTIVVTSIYGKGTSIRVTIPTITLEGK